MKTKFFGGSLGAVGLGVLAMFAAGCADAPANEPASQADENTDSQGAKIVSLGWGVDGCAASGMFNVSSGANQTLDFIAIDRSDFASLNSSLSLVDSFGQQTALNQSMVAADEYIQSMLNTFTNNINAAQQSAYNAAQSSSVAERWATTETQESSTVATVTNTSAAGSANTITESISHVDNAALANNQQFANQSAFAGGFGGGVVGGPWLGGVGGVGSNFFNNSFVNSGAFSNVANSANAYNRDAVHTDFANAAHTDTLITENRFLRTLLADRSAIATSAAQQSAASAFNQNSTAAGTNSASQAMSRASTYVFNNLSQLASNKVLLNVQAVSSATNQNSLLRIFAGNQFGVTGFSDFNTAFPTCGAGIGAIPAVAVPVVPAIP